MAGEPYLEYPMPNIKDFLGTKKIKALFIPYAGITFSYEEYEEKVKKRFQEIGHDLVSIHHFDNPIEAVENAEAIVVGGGNTFHLLKTIQENKLTEAIQKRVKEGIPYMGWSAGSNMACPTIKTTNDMPIIEPVSFNALGLVPFQINPHYLDFNPEGHGGETRQQRIEEFLAVNREMTVVGLREASLLFVEGNLIKLLGKRDMRLFRFGTEPVEYKPGSDLSFLL